MQVPSRVELERLYGEENAPDIEFLGVVTSWSSLRVLDYLYAEQSATPGEIAREANMDMREVKDRLDALAEQGVVAMEDGKWQVQTDEIQIHFRRDGGLVVSHSLEEVEEPDEERTGGFLSRVNRMLSSLLR